MLIKVNEDWKEQCKTWSLASSADKGVVKGTRYPAAANGWPFFTGDGGSIWTKTSGKNEMKNIATI